MAAQTELLYDGGYWYVHPAVDLTVDVYEGSVADDDAGIYDQGTYVETIVNGVGVPADVSNVCLWGPVTVNAGPPARRGRWFLLRSVVPLVLDDAFNVTDFLAQRGWTVDDLPYGRVGGI